MTPALRLVPPGLALIGVSYGLARFAYGLFLPSMRDAVGLTPTIAGAIGAGSYFGYCIAIVAGVWLVERLGARTVALTAGTIAAVGMAMIAMSRSAWVLAGAMLFAGLSTGLASPAMAMAVDNGIAPAGQPRANTIINSGTCIGVAISGPVALLAGGQWRVAYAGFALLALATTLWLGWSLPRRRVTGSAFAAGSERDVTDASTLPAALERPRVEGLLRPGATPLLLAGGAMGFSGAAYWTFSGDLIVDVGHLPRSVATSAWVLIGLAGLAGAAAGDLVRRFGLNTVHRGGLIAMAAAILALAVWPRAVPSVLASAALFGAAYILLTGVYLVWGLRVYATRPALGLGLPFLVIALAQIAGTLLAGVSIGHWGHVATFVTFAGVGVVATAFAYRGMEGTAPPAAAGRHRTA